MATEASLAEQTTDEVEESKVIDNAKVREEDNVSQPKQTEANGIEKDKVEAQAEFETSAADPKEIMEINDEISASEEPAPVVIEVKETDSQASGSEVLADNKKASASEELKEDNEDNVASPSVVLEDKKENAPAVDEFKKETVSQVSGSEVSATEELKKEDEGNIAPATAVLEEKEEDAPAVEEIKKETGSLASEILGDNKEKSASEEMKKEGEDDVVSASVVLEDKKEDAPTIDRVIKEDDSQASGFEVLVDNNEASTADGKKEDEDDTASASGVSVHKKEDAPLVDSEILGDCKEVSATEEMKKEDENYVVCASVALEGKKEDAPTVVKVQKEDDSEASSLEVLSDNNKAYISEEVKKEYEGDTASASGFSVDKKEDAPAADEASGSEVVEDNTDMTFIVEDVKNEAETGKTSGIIDAEVKASIESQEEKSINTSESSSSVQESEHVEHEPEVSEPVAATAKDTGEPLDISANVDLPSEAVATFEEQSAALTVTEPADATEEVEKKIETPEADEEMEVAKHENNTTVVENIATAHGSTVTEPFEEKSVVLETSASQTLDTVPSDFTLSENIEKTEDDTIVGQCREEVMAEESERNATVSLGKEATADNISPSPPVATGETGAVDASSVTDAAGISVDAERNTEEQKGEKTLEMELANEQKEEKSVKEEAIKEQDQEKDVERETILTAAEEIEATSERDKPSEDADKTSKVAREFPKEPKPEDITIEGNTTAAQTSRDIDLSGPATEVTEAAPEEEKPSEAADKIDEKRDSGVSYSASKPTGNLEKEKASEVAEQSVEAPKQENENTKDGDATLAQTSRDINFGQQTNDINVSTGEQLVKSDVEMSSNNAAKQDETEKKDEAGKSDAQDLVEAPKGGDSKPNPEVQKSETSGKTSKTLMSKVKHSIVKVKKAIIGKSPSSKTISAESKD